MNVLLANPIAAAFLLALFIALLIVAIAYTADQIESYSRPNYSWTVVCALLAGVSFYGFIWSSTHRLIEPNRVGILVDRNSGSILQGNHSSGVVKKAWTEKLYTFPANSSWQWCPELTPSVKGGTEVATTICLSTDASQIDWSEMFTMYNGDEETITQGWLDSGYQSSVAFAISQFTSSDLTNKRDGVELTITAALSSWATDNGIPPFKISIRNWRFTNEELQAAFEASQVSVALIDKATNEYEAARIQSETAKLRKDSCSNAGITSEGHCIQYLQLEWLRGLSELPDNFVLSLGNTVPSISFPAAPPATVVP